MTHIDDQTLLDRLDRGVTGALDELVERHKDSLYAFLYRMTADPDRAADLFQETWVRAIRGLPRFGRRSAFSTWLFQIAVNLCRDQQRGWRRWVFRPLDEVVEQLPDRSPGPSDEAAGLAERVWGLVAGLPADQRAVFVLRYQQDLETAEISRLLGCAEGTVKSRLHRAIQRIRRRWPAGTGQPGWVGGVS